MQTLLNKRQIVLKPLTTTQLYAQTNFHGWWTMTVNEKSALSPVLGVYRFRKILLRSAVELPKQAENDRVEQLRHYM